MDLLKITQCPLVAVDKSQFYLSTNYIGQDGMVVGDKYNRLSVKANASNVSMLQIIKK